MLRRNKGIPWRTVYVSPHCQLSVEEDSMKIVKENEENCLIPLCQIRTVLVTSHTGSISFELLNRLAEQKSTVIFCNKKHVAAAALETLTGHTEAAGRRIDQSQWLTRKKDSVWRFIVIMKINRQIELLDRLDIDVPCYLADCARNVETGDNTNREAVAAGYYFDCLFGKEFLRHHDDEINAALNYGYAIIRSTFCQAIASHGYSTALGIHHHSRTNNTNLACDMMEPFRPFVDEVVYKNQKKPFDREYQLELLKILYNDCIFDGKRMNVQTAIEEFTIEVLDAMTENRYNLREVYFA